MESITVAQKAKSLHAVVPHTPDTQKHTQKKYTKLETQIQANEAYKRLQNAYRTHKLQNAYIHKAHAALSLLEYLNARNSKELRSILQILQNAKFEEECYKMLEKHIARKQLRAETLKAQAHKDPDAIWYENELHRKEEELKEILKERKQNVLKYFE